MSHMVLVKAEVDEATKASAEKWLENQGIDPDEAIRLFYEEVVACHGLPFGRGARLGHQDEETSGNLYEELSAVAIPSVSGELREAKDEGTKMLDLLKEFKAAKELRKAARKAARQKREEAK